MTFQFTITFSDLIAVISLIVALISLYIAYRQYIHFIKEKNSQRILKKYFGSELFGKATIKNSTYCYVEPNCTDIDPTREAEPKNLCMVKGNMFSILDDYLLQELPKKNAIHHILILADSGMGKTSFLLNYYAYNQKKNKSKRQRIKLIPLGIPDADEYIEKIENKEETVIFLDAFDEDTKAIEDHRLRLTYLMKKCSLFKRVVITCRTQFFSSDEEIPKETGIVKIEPLKAGETGFYIFNKLYLSPLNDNQVNMYLRKRYKWNRNKQEEAKLLIDKIPNLKVRPMLLAYIPDLIESNRYYNTRYSFQLYEIMINKWLEREKVWIKNKENLRQFSENLAFNLYLNRKKRGAEKISKDELSFLAAEWNIELENWQLTGRSLLNRDAEGNYKFAHRSIMEFLFIVHFFKTEISKRPVTEWTDQQAMFALEYLKKDHYKIADLEKTNFRNAKNLPELIKKGLDQNGTFSQYQLLKSIKNGFKNIQKADLTNADLSNADLSGANLRDAILIDANLIGANLNGVNFTLANLKNANLVEANLSRTKLRGANLNGAKLSGVNFSGAELIAFDLSNYNLNGLNFTGTKFTGANLTGANLSEANLSDAILSGANLSEANLSEANLSKANLSGANLSGANLSGAILSNANLSGANLSEVDLSKTDLRGANISGTKIKKAKNLPKWIEKEILIWVQFV